MPTIETVEPMDKSMLPIVMTSVPPRASAVRTAACWRTLVANTMIRMASAISGRASASIAGGYR
jgi:hypothetical protein